MLGRYLSSEALLFSGFRLALAAALLLALAALWRSPRARAALAVVLALHVAAWLAYRLPLQRPYGVGLGSDRTFNLGMAASVAAGHSPWEHTQVGHGSPEPFWNLAVALLAGLDPERVPAAYEALTPLALLAVGLSTFAALRRRGASPDGEWDAVVIAFAVLSLSSLAVSPRPPVPPFWVANFLYKPNHGLGYALTVAALGLLARPRVPAVGLAAILGALSWVFLLGWGYTVAGVLLAAALRRPAERAWRPVLGAIAASAVVAAPYVVHLLRDYSPAQESATARHMWNDPNALLLAVPNWSTLDLGPLLVLGLAGLWLVRRREDPFQAAVLGFGLAAWAAWAASVPLALLGVAPEPDELHFYLRFVVSVAAGVALASGARLLAERGYGGGRGHLLVLAACVPLAFPVVHDPPTMDRYYPESREPVPPNVRAYAAWVRAHTSPDAVFVAGRSSGMWLPALTGRRVLLAHAGKLLPADHEERRVAERVLLTSVDPAAVRAAAVRYGVTHIAVDEELMHEYGAEGYAALARQPWHRTVFANTAARLVEIAVEDP